MSKELDTPIGALVKTSREYDSVVQANGFGRGEEKDKIVFTILVCATEDLDFNTRVRNELDKLVSRLEDEERGED